MNELGYLIQAAGTTLGLAFLALLLGLLIAMLFVFWESARHRIIAWPGTLLVMLIRGLPEILVVLGIYYGLSQLLLLLSDGFTVNLFLFQLPIKFTINDFDISPFFCGVLPLHYCMQPTPHKPFEAPLKRFRTAREKQGLHLVCPQAKSFFI